MISVDVILEDKRWSKKIKKPSIFFSKLLKLFQKRYSFSNKRANLSILLSNNNNIKKLNKKFRKKNKPTDILSFPFDRKFKKFFLNKFSNLCFDSFKNSFFFSQHLFIISQFNMVKI